MINYTRTILFALIAIVSMSSCEDVVDVSLDDGQPQLTVDAFLRNDKAPEVVLSMTGAYFDSADVQYVENASVTLTEGENVYNLTYSDNAYRMNDIINFEPNKEFKLSIEHDGNLYESVANSNPVPPLLTDSIVYEFEEETFGIEAGYFAEIRAYDILGRTDFYWIRYYRNDSLQNDPSTLILAQDAAFGGDGSDGFLFIPPIRQGINDFTRRYQPGEELKVEIWSIEENTWEYLNEVVEQTSIGGPLAIISAPTYNLRSNIEHISGPAELPALGMFSVSLVSSGEVIFE